MELARGYYAIIPASVRYDKKVSANAKLLYGEISALCNDKGFCWATNQYFTELYGVDKRTITRWITELVENGHLYKNIQYGDDGKTILQRCLSLCPITCDPMDKNVTPMDTSVTTPMDKNVTTQYGNNIIIYKPPITPPPEGEISVEQRSGVDAPNSGTNQTFESPRKETVQTQAMVEELSLVKRFTKEDCLSKLCKLYRTGRNNKTESRKNYFGYLAGTKKDRIDGKRYRYNHVQIYIAAEKYMREKHSTESDMVKLLSSYLSERVRDDIEATRGEYEAEMCKHYGERWREVNFAYD